MQGTLSDKDSFDVGELKAKMKRIWDYDDLVIYECRTNAIEGEIEKEMLKSRNLKSELVFVVPKGGLAERIRTVTEGKYNVIVWDS